MTKRILIIAPASGELGGIEVYSLRAASALMNTTDFDVELCFKRTARFDPKPEFQRALTSAQAHCTLVDRASVAMARSIQRADLVHMQNFSPDIAAVCAASQTPLLVTVHGHKHPNAPARRLAGERLSRMAVARWYNSQFTWSSWEGDQRRSTSRRVSMRPDAPLSPLPLAARRGFVFAARWVANKGLDTLIRAYAQAHLDREQWPLVLLGDGPQRAEIVSLLDELGVRAEMPGYVDELARWEALRSARWLVAPPKTGEDLGLTPIEARSVGVPCIVSRDGGLPEAAGAASLMSTPGDVAELSALLKLASQFPDAQYARWAEASVALLDVQHPPLSLEHPRLYRELFAGL